MTVDIIITELDTWVEFESGKEYYQPEESQNGTKESVVFEQTTWDKSKYTERDNKIIESYLPKVEELFEIMFFEQTEIDF